MAILGLSVFAYLILGLFQSEAISTSSLRKTIKYNETLLALSGSNCLLESAKHYFYRRNRPNVQTMVVSHAANLSRPAEMIQDAFLRLINDELVNSDVFNS